MVVTDRYDQWKDLNFYTSNRDKALLKALDGFEVKISIIIPVYNPSKDHFKWCLDSIFAQTYTNWEVCIADDNSDSWVGEYVKSFGDPRIKYVYLSRSGVSKATARAAELATGEFLMFLDHDDEIEPDAIGEVALALKEHPDCDVIYTDEDKIKNGKYCDPHFKPDWSPYLFLSCNYLNHFTGVRRSLYESIGGMRELDGVQDWDLYLRATEKARYIHHVPKVLYHWRRHENQESRLQHYAHAETGLNLIQETCSRRGINALVYQPDWAKGMNIAYELRFPDEGPGVTLIIPTKNQHHLISACINSLAKTTYKNYQILIVDNCSDDKEVISWLRSLPYRVITIPNPGNRFNFSAICNRAASMVSTPYVLFLNNDTEVVEGRWLSEMIGYIQLDKVGAVGARLLYSNFTIQHAGCIHALDDILPGHAFKDVGMGERGYHCLPWLPRECSAVTGACLLTSRKNFFETGGFNEEGFSIAYNDIDYCYRLGKKGLLSVYCPSALLIHHESTTRKHIHTPDELDHYKRTYRNYKECYYSPHFTNETITHKISPRTIAHQSVKNIKTLVVAPNLNLGGSQFIMRDVIKGLAERGIIEPTILSGKDGPLREDFSDFKIIIDKSVLYDNEIANTYVQNLSENFDVVYANTVLTFRSIDGAKRASVPSIWNIHESEPVPELTSCGFAVDKTILRHFLQPYKVIFGSAKTREAYLPYNQKNNFTYIRNVIDPKLLKFINKNEARDILGIGEDEFVVLCVGAVCERKGQIDLIDAFEKFDLNVAHKTRVYLVGMVPDRIFNARLESNLDLKPSYLQKRVKIIPETRNVGLYYSAADVFTLPSRIECFPRVVMEAMHYGLPIVASDIFGIPEQIRDEENGLLFQPRDYKTLAKHLQSICLNKNLRDNLCKGVKNLLSTFPTIEDNLDEYASIFQEAYLLRHHKLPREVRSFGKTIN